MNSEANLAGERIKRLAKTDIERIRFAYLLILGREPSASEFEVALKFLLNETYLGESHNWGALVHSIISSVQFRYLD